MANRSASSNVSAHAGSLIVLVSLLTWYAYVVYCSGSVIVDGFQSLGAVSDSQRPGSLHWPMMGTFMGYHETWGFHWIGWPMLRSLLLPVLAWHPLTEIILICLVWGGAAWLIMRMSRAEQNPEASLWIGLLTLVTTSFLVAAQSYRPEIPTALLLLLAIRLWNADTKKLIFARGMVLVALPLFHPMGLILPVAWCGWDFLFHLRRENFYSAGKKLILSSWPLIMGVMLMIAWFAFQSEAWEQFQWNLKSQRMLVEGMGTGWATFFRWGLGSLSSVPLIVVLLGASVGALRVLWLQWSQSNTALSNAPITYAGVGFLVALVFNIVAKNPNSLHLVAVLPMAVWLLVFLLQSIISMVSQHQWILRFVLSLILLVFLVYPAKLTRQIIQQKGQSYRGGLSDVLENLPPARKVLIPVAMWEAAQLRKGKTATIYQFSTFPNILMREQRRMYEEQVLADMQSGDILIWDPLQEAGGIFNFVEVTALRHVLLQPKNSEEWERLDDIRLSVQYSRSQNVAFEIYMRR